MSLPAWMTGCTYDASAGNDLRNSTVTSMLYDLGIVTGSTIGLMDGVIGNTGLAVSPGGGMSIFVGPGSAAVQAASPSAGGYTTTLGTRATLTVQTADPSNPRIDLVVVFVNDLGTSSSTGVAEIITGTPAASPSAPSAPATSLALAQLTIPAGTTTVTSGMISDQRVMTVAAGGVLCVSSKGAAPMGYRGQLAFDQAGGTFFHNDGSLTAQARLLPSAPVYVPLTSAYAYPAGHFSTILSTSFTTVGTTDLKVTFGVTSVSPNLTQDVALTHQILLDGSILATQTEYITSAGNLQQGGFTGVAYTDSSTGSTPGAGGHTITFQGETSFGSGSLPALHLVGGLGAYLRVEPVNL
jgi:hypothetical protein